FTLAGGARLVLAANTDATAWAARYPGVTPAGWFGGSLNNAGERISFFDPLGNIIDSVDYQPGGGWPVAADTGGRSLEILDPRGDPDAPANWQASAATNGSPGAANSTPPVPFVQINELMAENFNAVSNRATFPDWIELRNSAATNASLAGWSLSDDGNVRKFVFPSTNIVAGGYLTVWCDTATNTTPGLHTGFSLNKRGETVSLYNAASNRMDAVSYGLQLTNYSIGRVAGKWTLTTPTRNATNVAVALAATTNLVLNEWLANPVVGAPDWLELYNPAAAPVALDGIYLPTSNVV
ncbi:MAG: lamin tail domain-containing protein, partial [Verrucomicrobia bacterium]|nr:lamin tail domain-containing protein [Verrucomicrobiota bacterium]